MTESYSNIHGEWEQRKISIWGAARAFISQLRIGQDLTRISIPAIFFRPYSLLEEIATRVSSHFEILFEVKKFDDPVDRMLGVVKWLISSAKAEDFNHKPYNPVLGEFHKARVDHADGSSSFCITEQTVHHPPCSAFCVYNEQHGVTVEGNWIFDVTFHGNSVTVKTLGGLRVHIEKDGKKETYVLQKGVPDMLIQNVIFGTKYVVWTGDLDIVCEETEYRADLFFAYKNSANTISGTISKLQLIGSDEEDNAVEDSPPLYELKGVCGRETYLYPATKSKKEKKKEKKLFVDATAVVPAVPVYPEEEDLEETSSIRLWNQVNKAIVEGDMATADFYKTQIENAQRARVRDREAQGQVHETRYFVENDSGFWGVKNKFWYKEETDINPHAVPVEEGKSSDSNVNVSVNA